MTTIYWPAVSPSITEEAGTRGGTHAGIDLAAERGDPVLAAFDGEVVYAAGDGANGRLWLGYWLYPNGEGRTVDIRRSDGLISRVGHLDGYAVSYGQKVKAGQVIGYAGNTGYSTGVHIHWELRWDRAWSGGAWINPRTVSPQVYKTAANSAKTKWEDTMKHFTGKTTRTKVQKINGGKEEYVTFLDNHNDSKFGDRTIARGAGAIVGLEVNTRLIGEPGTRVNLSLVRETGAGKDRVTLGEARITLDTFGAGSEQIGYSGYLQAGQLVRLIAHVQKGKTIEVQHFYWSGMNRPG